MDELTKTKDKAFSESSLISNDWEAFEKGFDAGVKAHKELITNINMKEVLDSLEWIAKVAKDNGSYDCQEDIDNLKKIFLTLKEH